ncbi:MAG: c-type cytochrome, partial [Actinomycetota bacterium]|nr:c-type cytochrome [Actinomycetota bacterium]
MGHPRLLAVAAAVAITAGVLVVQGGAQASVQEVSSSPPSGLVAKGRQLFLPGCSGCHGVNGQGLRAPNGSLRGPSLKHSGEASAYYYLHTGRMPLGNSEDEPMRHKPAYSDADMKALVAYVGSLGNGPQIPDVRAQDGELGVGGELFRANCAACHSASGAGGALSYGRAAPSLASAKPLEIGSA